MEGLGSLGLMEPASVEKHHFLSEFIARMVSSRSWIEVEERA